MIVKEIDPRMIKARAQLIRDHPFYGTLAMYLQLVEDESVKTMAVDGTHLFYAPSYLDRITQKETQGVVAHEVKHCADMDHIRRGDRDPEEWNEACDYKINPALLKAGFTLPEGYLYEKQYEGMSAEEIYARRRKQKQQQPQSGQGQGQGQGSGQPKPLGQGGKVLDAATKAEPTKAAAQEAEWRRRVEQALSVARAAGAGTLPGDLEDVAKAQRKSYVDWRDELRRFIDDRARVDHTWTNPNRRFIGSGLILPGVVPEAIEKLGIVLDTSGSISQALVDKFLGEVNAAKELGQVEELIVVQADTAVRKVDRFTDTIDGIRVYGRGGTHFGAALKWFADNEPDVVALLFFTDLDTSGWGVDPGCPVLWVTYGYESEAERRMAKVPFGEVVYMRD